MSSSGSDFLLPFLIDAGAIRGRVVRLGPALNAILEGHAYPLPVAARLAETLALAAALAGALKFDGVFTLQLQTDGPISLVVADVTSTGNLRGYARFDAERLTQAEAAEGQPVPRYLGSGFLAFTVDQGPETDRYQGIVELAGDTLDQCVRQYFRQSEQIDTAFKLALRPPADGVGWQAAAVMIQRMPTGPFSPIYTAEEAAEAWNRAAVLLESATPGELFDPRLPAERLLYRLYHAEGLQTHEVRGLHARCRCSAERVAGTLRSFPRTEIESMKDESGAVVVVCEFCKTRYVFTDGDLGRLYGS